MPPYTAAMLSGTGCQLGFCASPPARTNTRTSYVRVFVRAGGEARTNTRT